MSVYLLHFEQPYYHARHYLGYTGNLEKRLAQHRRGREESVPLLRAVMQAGIGWRVACVWEEGDRALEKRLRQRKENPRLCPLCRAMCAHPGRRI